MEKSVRPCTAGIRRGGRGAGVRNCWWKNSLLTQRTTEATNKFDIQDVRPVAKESCFHGQEIFSQEQLDENARSTEGRSSPWG